MVFSLSFLSPIPSGVGLRAWPFFGPLLFLTFSSRWGPLSFCRVP